LNNKQSLLFSFLILDQALEIAGGESFSWIDAGAGLMRPGCDQRSIEGASRARSIAIRFQLSGRQH
jgi:hypothetical protein